MIDNNENYRHMALAYSGPVVRRGLQGVEFTANDSLFDNGHKYPNMVSLSLLEFGYFLLSCVKCSNDSIFFAFNQFEIDIYSRYRFRIDTFNQFEIDTCSRYQFRIV